MSYPPGPAFPVGAGEAAPPRRPAVVGLAAALLVVMALAGLAYAVAGLLVLDGTVDRFRAEATGTGAGRDDVDGVATLLRASSVLSVVLAVAAALLLVVLAIGLLARRNGVRVTAWVVCGLGLLAGCCGVTLLVGQRAVPWRPGADERATGELLAVLGDAYPSWWIPLNAGLSIGQALGYLVVATLLALPPANAWFRRSPTTVPPRP